MNRLQDSEDTRRYRRGEAVVHGPYLLGRRDLLDDSGLLHLLDIPGSPSSVSTRSAPLIATKHASDSLYLVHPFVHTQLRPQLVKGSLFGGVLADSAVPSRRLVLEFGARVCLDCLVEDLAFLPGRSAVEKSTTLSEEHLFRGEVCVMKEDKNTRVRSVYWDPLGRTTAHL